jgi:hypothetical protein
LIAVQFIKAFIQETLCITFCIDIGIGFWCW